MSFLSIIYTVFIMPLQLFFEVVFSFAQRFTGNPGLSIVVLSLTMNFLVLPLYKRADAIQAEQREIEKKLQPGISHIKKVYSGDEKMMMLQTYYRQNHYKPTDVFKESLSLLLQVPFFIAAYHFLSNLALLDGAVLGPIKDLGVQDGLISISGGITINLLPILMTVINIVSCIIYTKGFPLKSKLQLYIMAGLFLVLLYNSPAGLVFYWTLNNLFSLIKNIFFKLKDPVGVLTVLCSVTGVIFIIFGLFFFDNTTKRKLIVAGIGFIMQLPLLLQIIKRKKLLPDTAVFKLPESDSRLFLLSGILLTVLTGALIPSATINSSPQEFINSFYYHNPLVYVLYSLLVSFGLFVVWIGIFYSIADNTGRIIIEKLLVSFCAAAVLDYMFFGTKLGIISASLSFEKDLQYTKSEIIKNIIILLPVILIVILLSLKYERIVKYVLLTMSIALIAMTAFYSINIEKSVAPVAKRIAEGQFDGKINLSKKGKNVIVLMLDRAIGPYVPYIMNEKPELKEKFDGFTWYSNSISHGSSTNYATPALFGGYEYSPVEMNKRDKEEMVLKHNEALKVMPALFYNNGFEVTVCDVPYANYQWIPDLSIYSDYPDIKAFNTEGMFSEDIQKIEYLSVRRNFFFYSLMKAAPVFLQKYIYNGANYNHLSEKNGTSTVQVMDGCSRAEGISSGFTEAFDVLRNMDSLTQIIDENKNTFLMMNNNSTHEPCLLQEPEYLPAETVDNTEYDAENEGRFLIEGRRMKMESELHYSHYEVDMATFIQLGKWFDYMRENGVYDNTRIILVSDHGRGLDQFDELKICCNDGKEFDLECFSHLLMVKDFDDKGFSESDEFMTAGDVPTIAVADLFDKPENPFTGKIINNNEKNSQNQYLLTNSVWQIEKINGKQFFPGDWLTVHDNIWDKNNWRVVARNKVFTGEE